MQPVRVRAVARREIDAAFDWYLNNSASAAEGFIDAVDEALSQIAKTPEGYPVVRGRLRRVLLQHFPHAVYYKVYPNVISIVGIIHGRRHPNTWLRRAER